MSAQDANFRDMIKQKILTMKKIKAHEQIKQFEAKKLEFDEKFKKLVNKFAPELLLRFESAKNLLEEHGSEIMHLLKSDPNASKQAHEQAEGLRKEYDKLLVDIKYLKRDRLLAKRELQKQSGKMFPKTDTA
ncbi:MAG: hypothetical protein ABIH00_07225 [Armatimonadota bacterium]